MLSYLILFRARNFPEYYHVSFDEPMSEEEMQYELKELNIFNITLPSISELSKPNKYETHINYLSKNDLKEVDSDSDIPYIIVNPYSTSTENESKFCLMDHLMVATIPKPEIDK